MIVLLDAGPLGLLGHPSGRGPAHRARERARQLLDQGDELRVPEISDYEVRRELLRSGRGSGVEQLDDLAAELGYLPLTTVAWRLAAELWALARQQGRPTAADAALDGDVLLAAQARELTASTSDDVVVATMNVADLEPRVAVNDWRSVM